MRLIVRVPLVRECLIGLAFCVLTSAITWPYVTRLRDAVSGRNDPYLTSYLMWWDYHATFTNPLNLFHPNIFYPYRYVLAFSEHCYGIALPFFPLFALGFRPLTIHTVAVFFGIALSGYAAFRLARTLTGSYAIGWIAGIYFAFMPYRFNMLGQLMYLFSVWVPLLFEALVLFVQERSRKRAAWLGFAFFMTGLTTITWFLLSTVPLAIAAAILLTRKRLWRDRKFWQRGAIALAAGSLALLPFMIPYFIAAKVYGFKRRVDEVRAHSAFPIHWLVSDEHNRLWHGLGRDIPDAGKFQMFPGLLALVLSLAGSFFVAPARMRGYVNDRSVRRRQLIWGLDVFIVVAFVLSVVSLRFVEGNTFGEIFFRYLNADRAVALLSIGVLARLCLAYPNFLRRGEGANLIETIRSDRRTDAFWVGITLTVIGFSYSIGWNFFFYRILYDLVPGFKSMRAPMRGALFAYLGLALLAGLGTRRIAELVTRHLPRIKGFVVFSIVCGLLLLELNTVPLFFIRGEVYPDAVTRRLKQTNMRGGIAYLPMTLDLNHQYTLRAADHLKPLITATSSFNPPAFDQIDRLTNSGPIPTEFMDLLEKIPASYLVVENQLTEPERRADFTAFLARSLAAGRLRFINRFDGRNDLYAVTATEPEATSEAALPPDLNTREWPDLIAQDATNILAFEAWSQTICRGYLISFGRLPRFAEFINDVKTIGAGVIPGFESEERLLEGNVRRFAEAWTKRRDFVNLYRNLDTAQYVDRLAKNAGLRLQAAEREDLIGTLSNGQETRVTILYKLVRDPRFADAEKSRLTVLLYYFGYLQRNPDDPPDRNLDGFNFWVHQLESNYDVRKLDDAFKSSGEYMKLKDQR